MKLAVITDIHADLHALQDALVQIERFGCAKVICCGDLIDSGLFPEETLELLQSRGIPTIAGNHDRWAVRGGKDMSGWDLSSAALAYLQSLPASLSMVIEGVRIVAWHARPRSDMNGIPHDAPGHELARLLDEAAADVLVVGHTHDPFGRRIYDGRLVVNPGALLRDPVVPSEGVATPGTFGILDTTTRTFSVYRARTGELVTACVGHWDS